MKSNTSDYLQIADDYKDFDAVMIGKVAEKYKEAKDELKKINSSDILLIRKFIQYQFNHLSEVIYFDFVNGEPYNYDVCDWLVNDAKKGFIRVNATGNSSQFWEQYHNLQFRAVHDYIHAYHRLDFNLEDEIIAYKQQMEFSYSFESKFPFIDWDLYSKVLRSEIIYQAFYKTHFKEFHVPEQKIILSDL